MRPTSIVSLSLLLLPLWGCLDSADAGSPGATPDSGDAADTGSSHDSGADDSGPVADSGTDSDPADSGDTGDTDPADTGGANTDNPLEGATLWVDPDGRAAQQADAWRSSDPDGAELMDKIAGQPIGNWLGGWNGDVRADVDAVLDAAAGDVPVFVAYDIPERDCGSYSSGGAADLAAYTVWIDEVAAGLGGRAAVVVLEPDATALVDCLDAAGLQDRYDGLGYAIDTLEAAGGLVYVDAGHSAWTDAATMAERLALAGVDRAHGFALNVSNYRTNEELLDFADTLSEHLGGVHFVLDTSRNGLGPDPGGEWCNPPGRALGAPPSTVTGHASADAFLWVKAPGESDGSCNGGPSAGSWWAEYARGLAERAAW